MKEMTLGAPSGTVPLPEFVAEPDRRNATRFTTILRVGVIETEAGKDFCLIRNISEGGIMADLCAPLPVGARAEVELKSGQRVAGQVAWCDGARTGIKFDRLLEVEQVLMNYPVSEDGRRTRLPRIEISRFALLRIGARSYRTATIDLSQGGVKLRIGQRLSLSPATVTFSGHGPIEAAVRWSDAETAGLSFNHIMPFRELSKLIREGRT